MTKAELLKQIDTKIERYDSEIARLTKKKYGAETRVPFLDGKVQGLNVAYRLIQKLSQCEEQKKA